MRIVRVRIVGNIILYRCYNFHSVYFFAFFYGDEKCFLIYETNKIIKIKIKENVRVIVGTRSLLTFHSFDNEIE